MELSKKGVLTPESLSLLESDIKNYYGNGFDFSESARRLVETRTGCVFSLEKCDELKQRMFKRNDGLWFFEDQVGDAQLRCRIADQCRCWLDELPLVSLDQFVEIITPYVSNIEDHQDKISYAEHVIKRSNLGGAVEFCGRISQRICFLVEYGIERSKRVFAERVEQILRERSDAVLTMELASVFPMVSTEWMVKNLPELLPDAIQEELMDDTRAFRLLEFYYLPGDFSEKLQSLIDNLEASGEGLSATRILNGLGSIYGCDFAESYGLTKRIFKQIVTRIDCNHREWVRGFLGRDEDASQNQLSFVQVIEKKFPRIFSHEEFYQFGVKFWGWSEVHRVQHHRQLWNDFIRYDADHWSSVGYFMRATCWSANVEAKISNELDSLLGTRQFFPLAKVSQQFFDKLPNLAIRGINIRWTAELLASVAYFCLPRVRVIHHANATHLVTSLLVPSHIPPDTDGVVYMTQVFKRQHPYASRGDFKSDTYQHQAIAFLLENCVRRNESRKLRSKVFDILTQEVV